MRPLTATTSISQQQQSFIDASLPAIVQLPVVSRDDDLQADHWRNVIRLRKAAIDCKDDRAMRKDVTGVESWSGNKGKTGKEGTEKGGLKTLQDAPLYDGLTS